MTLERVRVRDCACPGTPHVEEGDAVFLHPKLSATGGMAAELVITGWMADQARQGKRSADLDGEVTRELLLLFVRHEAVGWNLVDAEGDPIPFDVDDLLADWALARPVTIRAGDLYSKTVIAPFQRTPAERSPTGQMPATTSRTRKRTPSPSE